MSQTTAGPDLQLSSEFRGETIPPTAREYDSVRALYNRGVDKRPRLIIRPHGAADVIEAVNLARESGLPLAVRCGGHGVAGTATVEDGIVIDLRSLKGVHVDPARRVATAEGGVTWGEYDRETQLFGLATPGGRVTTTGIGGFTLGGGYGWLSAAYGLACDNLVGADVVTADGRLVHASEEENPDLLWGLRGAGANFGVVTSYELSLHPVGPMVLAGLAALPNDGSAGLVDVVRGWRDFNADAPDKVMTAIVTTLAPPAPFVPPELVGKPILGMVAGYCGDVAEGQEVLQPLRDLMAGGVDIIQPMPYTAFQTMLDDFSPEGWLNYHGGMHLRGLLDEVIEDYLAAGREIGSPMDQGVVFHHGGAVGRVAEDATAVSNRSAAFMAHPIACWESEDQTEREMGWVRRFNEAFAPARTGKVYLNFEPSTSEDAVRSGFAEEKYRRLVGLKDTWDPTNLFRANHNIPPTGWEPTLPAQRAAQEAGDTGARPSPA